MDGEAGQTILVTEELLPDLLGRHVLLVPAQPVSDMEEQSDKKTSETKENTNSQASENEVNESEVNKTEVNETEVIKTEVSDNTEAEKVATEEFNDKEENNILDKESCDHPQQALETALPETSCNDSNENSDVLESKNSKVKELEAKLDSANDHPIIEKEVEDGSFDAKEEKTFENNIVEEKEPEKIKLETVATEKEISEKIEEHSNGENSNEKNAESKTVEESKQSDSKQDVNPPEELIVVDISNNAANLESNDSPREEKVFDSMKENDSEESVKEPKKAKKRHQRKSVEQQVNLIWERNKQNWMKGKILKRLLQIPVLKMKLIKPKIP